VVQSSYLRLQRGSDLDDIQLFDFCSDTCDPLESQEASKQFGIQSETNLFAVLEYIIKTTR